MSGILGILNLDGASIDVQVLTAMTLSLKFRAPDAQAIWVRENVGLGHALLHTDEPAPARGPVALDGTLWITADARLDGRDELLRKLKSGGEHPSRDASDSELILRAYRLWRMDFVQHLAGDFAFAIWDDRWKQLIAARDPLGIKPLYYSHVGQTVVLSNTLDCVRLHPSVSSRLDELAVADFLLFGHNQDLETTTFADIRKVPPGNLLTVTPGRNTVEPHSYWTFTRPSPIRYRREEDYVEHFRDVLRVAVEDRVRGAGCAIFMSGGLDSSALAATARDVLASRGSHRGVKAVTWVYESLVPHDERLFADLVAKHLDIPVCYQPADGFEWLEKLGEPGYRTPEPFDDPGYSLSVHLSRAAAEQSRIVLTGDDGDSLFSPASVMGSLRQTSIVDVAHDVMQYVRAERRRPPLGLGILRRARNWRSPAPPYPGWLNPDLERKWSLRERFRSVWCCWRETGQSAAASAPHCFRHPLHQTVWESQDPGFIGLHLESRYPLLDLRVIEFVLSIPALVWHPGKRLLRVAMRQSLPHEVLERPKTPVPGYWEARLHQSGLTARTAAISATLALSEYVRPDAIPEFDPNARVDDAWLNMRPLLLNQWLASALPPASFSLGTREVAC